MTRALILTAALALVAGQAFAGQAVSLRTDPLDDDGVVTLGELFEGAGAAAKTPVAGKPGASVTLDAFAVQGAARRAGLDWANAEGYRRIVVRSGATAQSSAAKGGVDVLTYARNFNAGDVVQPQDLVWGKAVSARAGAPADPAAVIGMAARRPLRAGALVSTRDLAAALVIKAGDTVTVAYENGGISLSLIGKATAQGGVGDTVSILNPASKKVIQAVATGPGQAVVGPAADDFRAQRAPQYALR
ncbi:flagellar basal body P-ring formation chaperone FlgA [Phenylobacterium sp.]|uniref:flagellar basal body P-ring formation chaperone FlgA n=1 Tax=Phenylobacterium sp. TaxID=1871053 RepID=UPI002735C5C9|nr:flagellar basal body P-ring formation chaperone FlgA [Phenylobacterium sp.]MDP3659556.1 flagellar basal body P-ring formation chaperone FlgA [Phenylobacterium sp.]